MAQRMLLLMTVNANEVSKSFVAEKSQHNHHSAWQKEPTDHLVAHGIVAIPMAVHYEGHKGVSSRFGFSLWSHRSLCKWSNKDHYCMDDHFTLQMAATISNSTLVLKQRVDFPARITASLLLSKQNYECGILGKATIKLHISAMSTHSEGQI